MIHWLDTLQPQHAVLIAAAFATVVWLYAARKQRTLAKKQHTLNVILAAESNVNFVAAQKAIRPFIVAKTCPEFVGTDHPDKESYRVVLNHYELLATGIRNGDFDERMVKDIQRGTVVTAWEACEGNIFKMRTARNRRTVHEHFEWLHRRWETRRPGLLQRFAEWIKGSPFGGWRVNPHG